MSSLIVEVCKVDAVEKHPQADKLSICTVKAWKVCAGYDPATGKFQFNPGDKCIYIPPDSVLPPTLSDKLGVTKYLSPLRKLSDGSRPPGGRVRVAKLRGLPSYGLIIPLEGHVSPDLAPGTDVVETLGITKWEPPLDAYDGEQEVPHPAFHGYTDIENYRNFPDLLKEGEEVVITEKIHGKNARLGLIWAYEDNDDYKKTFMAGSHAHRRKEVDAKGRRSQFWQIMDLPGIKELLEYASGELTGRRQSVIIFGELYGSGVQDLTYGFENGKWGFRGFDISIDGRYLDYDQKDELFDKFDIDMVPILYRGPFSKEIVEKYASGPTTVCPLDQILVDFKSREGIVITPTKERIEVTPEHVFNRVILKCLSFEYLEREGGTEYH